MAYKIDDGCIVCGTCFLECPVAAISEGEETYSIDPTVCVECKGYFDEPNCARICPTEICVPEDEK